MDATATVVVVSATVISRCSNNMLLECYSNFRLLVFFFILSLGISWFHSTRWCTCIAFVNVFVYVLMSDFICLARRHKDRITIWFQASRSMPSTINIYTCLIYSLTKHTVRNNVNWFILPVDLKSIASNSRIRTEHWASSSA